MWHSKPQVPSWEGQPGEWICGLQNAEPIRTRYSSRSGAEACKFHNSTACRGWEESRTAGDALQCMTSRSKAMPPCTHHPRWQLDTPLHQTSLHQALIEDLHTIGVLRVIWTRSKQDKHHLRDVQETPVLTCADMSWQTCTVLGHGEQYVLCHAVEWSANLYTHAGHLAAAGVHSKMLDRCQCRQGCWQIATTAGWLAQLCYLLLE
jgi:hypothetical protein